MKHNAKDTTTKQLDDAPEIDLEYQHDYPATSEPVSDVQAIAQASDSPMTRITGEVAIYGLILVIAFGLRLANLTHYPLLATEASQGLVSLSVYQNNVLETKTSYSPLFITLSSFAFLLFGDTNWSLRLASALIGSLIVILPFGLRNLLGIRGALVTSALLAISATSLFWSRLATGDIALLLGLFLLFIGINQWLLQNKEQGIYLIGLSLVILLLSSTVGYTALLTLAVLSLIISLINNQATRFVHQKFREDTLAFRQAGIFSVMVLLILATASLFNITGLAAASDLINQWFSQFRLAPQVGDAYPVILLLIMYEPLPLVLGGIGLAFAMQSRNTFNVLLAVWVALIFSVDLLMAGRSDSQVLLALFPLILLAGKTIGELWTACEHEGKFESDGLFIGVSLMISGFIYITLLNWTKCGSAQAGCDTAWILPVVGAIFIIGLAVLFIFWYNLQTAWRGLGAVLVVVFCTISLSQAWRLNYAPLADLAYQPLMQNAPSAQVPLFLTELSRLSATETGDNTMLDIAVVDFDQPLIRWYLRHYPRATYLNDFSLAQSHPAVLTKPLLDQSSAEAYVGTKFTLTTTWNISTLQGKNWIRWYLQRSMLGPTTPTEEVVLWIKP